MGLATRNPDEGRLATVRLSANIEIQTPACLSYTRFGSIPHIVDPAETLSKDVSSVLNATTEQFLDMVVPMAKLHQPSGECIESSQDLFEHLSVDAEGTAIIATPFDVLRLPEIGEWVASTKTAVGMMARLDRNVQVTPAMFVDVLKRLKPTIAVCMADLEKSLYDKGSGAQKPSSRTQLRKRSMRNINYLSAIVELWKQESEAKTCLFAPLTGEHDWVERRFVTEQVESISNEANDTIKGYAVYLPPADSTFPRGTKLADYVKASLDPLQDRSKPVIVLGVTRVQDCVSLIAQGVDLIDDSMVTSLSNSGIALFCSFARSVSLSYHKLDVAATSTGSKTHFALLHPHVIHADLNPTATLKMRLAHGSAVNNTLESSDGQQGLSHETNSNSVWRSDCLPLSPNCGCWTCKRPHSRAYIHHLLTVNDMLAYVLLMYHNSFQFQSFVDEIRNSLKGGSFDDLARAFDDV